MQFGLTFSPLVNCAVTIRPEIFFSLVKITKIFAYVFILKFDVGVSHL